MDSPSNMLTRRSLIYQRRRKMGGWGALGRGGVTGGRAGVVGGEAADLIIIMLMRTMMLMKMVVLMPNA